MNVSAEASRRGRSNKNRGKAFERKIGHEICDALGLEYGVDIARDVLSGGGVWKGDLHPITAKAQKIFPYVVECKYHQDWTWNQFLGGKGKLYGWLDQLIEEYKSVKKHRKVTPLLIFSKPRDITYVCSWCNMKSTYPQVLIRYNKDVWYCTELSKFLAYKEVTPQN